MESFGHLRGFTIGVAFWSTRLGGFHPGNNHILLSSAHVQVQARLWGLWGDMGRPWGALGRPGETQERPGKTQERPGEICGLYGQGQEKGDCAACGQEGTGDRPTYSLRRPCAPACHHHISDSQTQMYPAVTVPSENLLARGSGNIKPTLAPV